MHPTASSSSPPSSPAEVPWGALKLVVGLALLVDGLLLLPYVGSIMGPGSPLRFLGQASVAAPWITAGWCVYVLLLVVYLARPLSVPLALAQTLAGAAISAWTASAGAQLWYGLHAYAQFLSLGLLLARWLGPKEASFVWQHLKLLLALAYLESGVGKLLTPGWWEGQVLWQMLGERWGYASVAGWSEWLGPLGIGLAAFQASVPLALLSKRGKWIWGRGLCAMHVATALATEVWLFSGFMAAVSALFFATDNRPWLPEGLSKTSPSRRAG